MLGNEGFKQFNNLLLLATRQTGSGLEELTELAACRLQPLGLRLSEKFLDRNPEGLGHRNQDIGAGKLPRRLPIADVGLILLDLPGQLTLGESGSLTQGTKSGCSLGHIPIIRAS